MTEVDIAITNESLHQQTSIESSHIASQASAMSLARQVPRLASRLTFTTRPLSTSAARMAGGDAGAPRSGGAAQGDAFTKREQASEDYYVKQQEREKLEALKKKIAQQQGDLDKSQQELDALNKK